MDIIKILYVLLCYVIGALPVSWLVFKLFTGKDIRKEGTGNVGAMNTYESSGRKIAGVIAFLGDAAKGMLAVAVARLFYDEYFIMTGFAVICAVIGHNYSVFLKFKGGRGLATAAGALLLLNPLPVILWVIMWVAGFYGIRKDVHIANSFACIVSIVALYSAPDYVLYQFNIMNIWEYNLFKYMYVIICAIILIKHFYPLREFFFHKRKNDLDK